MPRWIVHALLLVAGIAPGAWSQELGPADSGSAGAFLWKGRAGPPSALSAATPAGLLPGPAVKPVPDLESGLFVFDPRAEELSALVAHRPPRIERDDLEGASEARQRFHGLPGGIVLGLPALPAAPLLGALAGARLVRDGAGRLVLQLSPERTWLLPAVDAGTLQACLAFVAAADGSDALVDCMFGVTHLAPAFEGTPLAPLLVSADQTPHRVFPESSRWKSLIVDRGVSFEARGATLFLDAALELRFYEEPRGGSGASARVLTLALPGPEGCTCLRRGACSAGAPELSRALAPVVELAAWIGFLRWARASDPAGFAELLR